MKTCISCSANNSKYKCPTCFVFYCSLPCYKQHSTAKCTRPDNSKNTPTTTESKKETFVTSDTVPNDKMQLLGKNEEVKDLLKNKHLRDLLTQIDSCENPEKMMQKAMLEPIFVELADACLKVVDPPPP